MQGVINRFAYLNLKGDFERERERGIANARTNWYWEKTWSHYH